MSACLPPARPDVDLDEIRHCLDLGRSVDSLAELYGVTPQTLARDMRRKGAPDLERRIMRRLGTAPADPRRPNGDN